MAPVIFTGVSMRAILLAAAAAIWAGQAGAAVYEYKFVFTEGGDPEFAQGFLLIDVPQTGVVIDQYLVNDCYDDPSCQTSFLHPVLDAPIMTSEGSPAFYDAYLYLVLGGDGAIVDLSLRYDLLGSVFRWNATTFETGMDLGDGETDLVTAEGYWAVKEVSPVPLPATAPLLLLGIGALAMRRRHRPVDIPSVAA